MSFSGIEPQIVERIKAAMPGVTVIPVSAYADIADGSQPARAVFVAYQGYKVIESRSDGLAVQVEQTWLTVVARRNVRQTAGAQPAREDAAAMLDGLFLALAGFKPAGAQSVLKLADGPDVDYSAGQALYPLAWAVKTVLRGNP